MVQQSFESKYPHIDRWVHEHQGWIAIGTDYASLDEALRDLDVNIGAYLQELYGEA